MEFLNATDVRKKWSVTLDSVLHDRPAYVRRTRDELAIINMDTMNLILSEYKFVATEYVEDDGSITLSLNSIDLAVNASDEQAARKLLAADIKEYAEDYYDNYATWSRSSDRRMHIPYVLKALISDAEDIEIEIECHSGKN